MSVTVPPEKVGAKIVEWYNFVIARSVDQAIERKNEIEVMLGQMESSDRILAYYSLVEFRHDLMCNQVSNGTEDKLMLEQVSEVVENSIDHMLQYLYYFVSGQNEFVNERHHAAIALFRKAERLLEYVDDEAEEAEFHYYIGYSLYKISQYPFASSYIEEALMAFDRLGYIERSISCQTILGGIFSETKQHDKAVAILEKALSAAADYPLAQIAVIRVLGLDAIRQQDYPKAQDYFEEALSNPDFTNNILTAKSQFNLANVLFRLDMPQKAAIHLEIAYTAARQFNSVEYQARCLATTGLYVNYNQEQIDQAIKRLSSNKMDFEVDEIAEEATNFFEKEGNSQLALKYLRVAYNARQNLSKIGVDRQ